MDDGEQFLLERIRKNEAAIEALRRDYTLLLINTNRLTDKLDAAMQAMDDYKNMVKNLELDLDGLPSSENSSIKPSQSVIVAVISSVVTLSLTIFTGLLDIIKSLIPQ